MRFLTREVASFHAAALILGGAAFLSKLLGLARDRLLAARFGAGDVLDAYYAAFQIPDFLFTVFLIGASSAAVLPLFLALERRGPEAAERFVSKLLTAFALLAAVATVAAMAFAPWLVRIAAPGFGPEKLAVAISLSRLMMATALFLGVAGILSSVLQARRRFFVFALPPVLYNLGIIFGIVALVPIAGSRGLAYGVLAGGVLQVLVALPAFRAMRFRLRPELDFRDPGLRGVARVSLPRVAAIGAAQLNALALGAIASFFAPGSLAAFKLALNLVYVPVGLFGVSYALALFPKLSGAWLEGQPERFRDSLAAGVRAILLWTLPAAALAVVLRAHAVRVILGSGAFDWEDTRTVAALLAVLAGAIVSESVVPLILRAFYALGRTREPLLWSAIGSAATVATGIGLVALFARQPAILAAVARILRIGDLPAPEIVAVAAAFSVGSILNALLLARAFGRAARERFGVELSLGLGGMLPMAGAALAAGIAAYVVLLPFPSFVATNTFLGILAQGAVGGSVGLAVYGVLLWWWRNPEILAIAESFRRRLITLRRTPEIYETEKLDGNGR